MKYSRPLQRVTLLRRYKRFLADVEWPDGSRMTVHTANTGSMLGCSTPGTHIWIRDSGNDKRKYRYSWEISETEAGGLVGVNTGLANRLAVEAISNGVIPELADYQQLRTEVPYGENSRIDILLQQHRREGPDCYVEVKNVTARMDDFAVFPDAVTARGTKHLLELMNMVAAGRRAMMLYCVQRGDVERFRPAVEIDPEYAKTLVYSVKNGVEALAYRAAISPEEIRLCERLPLQL